jgi:hypothetical protein
MRLGEEKRFDGVYLPHHALGEGLVIWKVARVVPTRVLMTAKKASGELNIFY